MSSRVTYEYLCECANAFISVRNWSEASNPNWSIHEHTRTHICMISAGQAGAGGGVAYMDSHSYICMCTSISTYVCVSISALVM